MADGTGLAFADDIAAGARELILRVLDGFDLGEPLSADVSILAGGASNANYLLTAADGSRRVLRIASRTGERLGYSRWDGVAAHGAAAAAGLAPPIRAVTLPAGHMLTDFIDGPVLDGDSIRSPGMLERIGRTLAGVPRRAARFAGGSRSSTTSAGTRRCRGRRVSTSRPTSTTLNRVAADIEASLARAQTPDRLCHNDLQLPNFIITGRHDGGARLGVGRHGQPVLRPRRHRGERRARPGRGAPLAAAYFASDDPVHESRVELMMFMSALREATWALVAEPVLELDWDYQAWAGEYFGRCRQSVASGRIGAALEVSG